MRTVNAKDIQKIVEELCIKANTELRPDILKALKNAIRSDNNKKAKESLQAIVKNAEIAKKENIAICQDTGMVSVYVEIGDGVKITGGDLQKSIDQGVENGYRKGCFRKSIVKDPLLRKGGLGNTPAILYIKFRKGNKIKIIVSPKGFGSENKTKLKMFNPTSPISDIKNFIIETVKEAGPDACPPFIIGVGIGGTADKAVSLAKEAALRPINRRSPVAYLARLEKNILEDINKLGIGPMGIGGETTALGVNALSYPTHIAGMPVAVNVGCHATRSAEKTI